MTGQRFATIWRKILKRKIGSGAKNEFHKISVEKGDTASEFHFFKMSYEYSELAPFSFDPAVNLHCARPLPATHGTFLDELERPLTISFPTEHQARNSNALAVLPLGGTLTMDVQLLSQSIRAHAGARPPITEIMRCVQGYRVANTTYVRDILKDDVYDTKRVGPLFGYDRNPFFPFDTHLGHKTEKVSLARSHSRSLFALTLSLVGAESFPTSERAEARGVCLYHHLTSLDDGQGSLARVLGV